MSFRFDRFTTLYVVNPIRRRIPSSDPRVPILMYHSISEADESGVHPYYRTATAPPMFAMHMRYLYEQGYSTINLPEAIRLLQSGTLTNKHVVITFDDGYRDFHQHGFPALSKYGFTATVFLPTDYIGTAPVRFKDKDCLTWAEVRELRKYNICFGSHTVTHPQLSALDDQAVARELETSKKVIEDNIGESVDSFSYPYAFPEEKIAFTKMLRTALVASGYDQGVSTRIGAARSEEDRYFLRRLPVNSLDDVALFDAKLQGAYDWLHTIQHVSKRLKG
jgi:peptidoglycan/xylan/chitin deacetylase (PgdA/CDA1 family)